MKRACFAFIAAILTLASATVFSEVPNLINYQATIEGPEGPVNGLFTITFRIYPDSTGTDVLWEEVHADTPIENGLVYAILGTGTYMPVSLFDGGERWMGITIDDDPEISPRMRITATPWSLRSGVADSAVVAGGGAGLTLPYAGTHETSDAVFSIVNSGDGVGIYAESGADGWAADFKGNIRVRSAYTSTTVVELGEGLDYAEGFDVSSRENVGPGCVMVIDDDNPGRLVLSTREYDSRVAGIAAGANGLGSGVRLGAQGFDLDVALAGRVYCNVEAFESGVEPGDLLTTSDISGYAKKAMDRDRAQGAILGKAMEGLERGTKGKILVLVTLQ
jgi:hypothetical protein